MPLYDDAPPSLARELAIDDGSFGGEAAFSLAELDAFDSLLEQNNFGSIATGLNDPECTFSLDTPQFRDATKDEDVAPSPRDQMAVSPTALLEACKRESRALAAGESERGRSSQQNKRQRCSLVDSPPRSKRSKIIRKRPDKTEKSRRTLISEEAKSILDSYFQAEQYPKDVDVDSLAQRCVITPKAVKTWFSNARARRTPGTLIASGGIPDRSSPLPGLNLVSQAITTNDGHVQLSRDALRASPAPSNLSLERYLASPPQDEPASPAAIEDNIKADYLPHQAGDLVPIDLPAPSDCCGAPVIDGMDATLAAHFSMKAALLAQHPPEEDIPGFGYSERHRNGSVASVASGDRGSRRGRRKWGGGSSQSLSDYGNNSPATPHAALGDDFPSLYYQFPATGTIPKFERTYTDPSADWTHSSLFFYAPVQPGPSTKADENISFLSPYRFNIPNDLIPTPDAAQATIVQRPSGRGQSFSPCVPGSLDASPSQNLVHEPTAAPEYGHERSAKVQTCYFCTFPGCPATFSQRYQWTRHENSVHSSQTVWICCRTDSGFADVMHFTVHGMETCCLCDKPNPTYGHIIEQHFNKCLDKPESERTFFRRDNLAQHIKHCHLKDTTDDCSVPSILLDLWKRTMPEVPQGSPLLKCGFCDKGLQSWKSRLAHVGSHFENGWDMASWNYGDTTSQGVER